MPTHNFMHPEDAPRPRIARTFERPPVQAKRGPNPVLVDRIGRYVEYALIGLIGAAAVWFAIELAQFYIHR